MAAKFVLALMLAMCCSAMAAAPQPWNGAVWQKKVTLFFTLYDMNKDGIQNQTDVNLLANGYQTNPPTFTSTAKVAQVTGILTGTWFKLYINKPSGATTNVKTLIKCVSDLGYADAVLSAAFCSPMFLMIYDTNSDGVIEKSEFQFFFNLLGMSSSAITTSFNTLDTDKSGTVSSTENINGWVDFFSTSNPTDKYNILLGPLPAK
jgi:hypothetical protein